MEEHEQQVVLGWSRGGPRCPPPRIRARRNPHRRRTPSATALASHPAAAAAAAFHWAASSASPRAGRRASRIRKGGNVAVFRGFRTNSSAVFRARTAGIHNVAGIPGQGGGRGAWYEGVYLHNTRLSGITTGGYMQICPTSSPIHRMLIQRPRFEFL